MVYNPKNDPAGPRKDASGLNASSASRPSSGGSGSSTSGGNKSSGGTGLTTGKTIYGNTAYGPAGGSAKGYATASTNKATGKTTYSNYRTPEGGKANVSYAGSGGAGNTVRSPSKQNITSAGVNYTTKPAAPVKPKAPAGFQNLQAGYNYQYPKGMSAGNYMLNPTDQPAKRGPSGSGMGTTTTMRKNNPGAPGYSVQKKNNMGMAKGGMVPGAKKTMAPMAKKGSKPMSKPVGKMGMMSMMTKKPKR
jgi:hypothetical protein